jgi:hypothetical protein
MVVVVVIIIVIRGIIIGRRNCSNNRMIKNWRRLFNNLINKKRMIFKNKNRRKRNLKNLLYLKILNLNKLIVKIWLVKILKHLLIIINKRNNLQN